MRRRKNPNRHRSFRRACIGAFVDAGTIVLHRYSTRGDAYQTFLDNLIGLDAADAIDPLRKAGLKRVATHRDGEGPGRVDRGRAERCCRFPSATRRHCLAPA